MATAEGVFPKLGNDPLYASEVNRFSPKLIGQVLTTNGIFSCGSNANPVSLRGPILYLGAGSSQISEFLILRGCATYNGDANTQSRMRISGTAGLNNLTTPILQMSGAAGTIHIHFYEYFLTSGVITASGGNIGSSYDLFFEFASDLDQTTSVGTFS